MGSQWLSPEKGTLLSLSSGVLLFQQREEFLVKMKDS